MSPPDCTPVRNISTVGANSFIDLIVARVLVIRDGRFFTLTDFGSRQLSGMTAEVVVNFSDEWRPSPLLKVGNVVVLRGFKKMRGHKKGNSMLYFNRAKSGVMFYNAQKQVYGKHFLGQAGRIEEFSRGSDNHRYVVSLIDDWKDDPRAVPMKKTPTPRAVSTKMSLKEAYDRFDTTRLVTINGKLNLGDDGLFYLTDSIDCTVSLEGFRVEERLKQQLRHEDTSYIQITNAKCQARTRDQKDKTKMRVKITDISTISTLIPIERRHLKEKLTPKPLPTSYLATPDQSLDAISSLENIDVWEPEEDELDSIFAGVTEAKFDKSVPSEAPQTPKSQVHIGSESDEDDSLESFTDFIYHGPRPDRVDLSSPLVSGRSITKRNVPPQSGQPIMTSTPKAQGSKSPPHDSTKQLFQCVSGSSDLDPFSSPVRKRPKIDRST
ncbi:YALIA101S10e05490g1_1 [Yarrowia lipolytica]|nr:YALIA101S10e05490g1_1 [Yarrowia lipolytica]VBB88765.1 Conserved hypothetical protein [Yarrowia lipolytica]